MTELTYRMKQHSVQDLIDRYDRGTLNLEPGFQRKSVLSLADRKKLIENIVHGYPLPALIFYKRNEDGRTATTSEAFRVINGSWITPSCSGGAPA